MIMHPLRVLCVLIASLSWIGTAWPQAQGPSSRPSPEVMAAAKELIVLTKGVEQLKALLPLIAQNLKPAIVQGRPAVERDYDAIMPKMLEGFSARLGDLADMVAIVYANNFSLEELRAIASFYRSPVGQKLLERQPIIVQQSMQAGQLLGKSVTDEVMPRLIEELRKRGHNI
jgi:hypothetical protein